MGKELLKIPLRSTAHVFAIVSGKTRKTQKTRETQQEARGVRSKIFKIPSRHLRHSRPLRSTAHVFAMRLAAGFSLKRRLQKH